MRIADYLSAAELRALSAPSNRWAFWLLFQNWAIIFLCLWLAWRYPNPFIVLLAVFIIGGRQLGLGVLMHEAGHRSLFATAKLNRLLGQWLCAYPILAEVEAYANGHRSHHLQAGTEADPDLPNYAAYPVTRASLLRKMWRDLSGQTGLKLLLGSFNNERDLTGTEGRASGHIWLALLSNVVLLLVVSVLMAPWVYLLWLGAFLTTFTWCSRIRQIAEHGAVSDLMDKDPRLHTRTTFANLAERLIFCPNYVNYHCEHHLAPTVPCYRLPALHQLLRERGFYKGYEQSLSQGYLSVLREALRPV